MTSERNEIRCKCRSEYNGIRGEKMVGSNRENTESNRLFHGHKHTHTHIHKYPL